MTTIASPFALLVRLAAPFVWRHEKKIASKLEGFAATEAGSALDMLKAAELTDDPKLRRLFFRHAMDEARHAEMFRQAARRVFPEARQESSEYNLIHATRQNLFARFGLVRFVAFVYLAEVAGELQFRALAKHFEGRDDLATLFERIQKDERFHVKYTKRLLATWRAEGRSGEVRLALLRVRTARAWEAWRRAGRLIGDAMSRAVLSLFYLVALPLFAWIQRTREPERAGWKTRPKALARRSALESARDQF